MSDLFRGVPVKSSVPGCDAVQRHRSTSASEKLNTRIVTAVQVHSFWLRWGLRQKAAPKFSHLYTNIHGSYSRIRELSYQHFKATFPPWTRFASPHNEIKFYTSPIRNKKKNILYSLHEMHKIAHNVCLSVLIFQSTNFIRLHWLYGDLQ